MHAIVACQPAVTVSQLNSAAAVPARALRAPTMCCGVLLAPSWSQAIKNASQRLVKAHTFPLAALHAMWTAGASPQLVALQLPMPRGCGGAPPQQPLLHPVQLSPCDATAPDAHLWAIFGHEMRREGLLGGRDEMRQNLQACNVPQLGSRVGTEAGPSGGQLYAAHQGELAATVSLPAERGTCGAACIAVCAARPAQRGQRGTCGAACIAVCDLRCSWACWSGRRRRWHETGRSLNTPPPHGFVAQSP